MTRVRCIFIAAVNPGSGIHPEWRKGYTVPDDLGESDGWYVLSYHGMARGERWQSGLAVSPDLRHWRSVSLRPVTRVTAVMFWLQGEVPAQVLEYDDTIRLLTLKENHP
jgi:hypothetical protein